MQQNAHARQRLFDVAAPYLSRADRPIIVNSYGRSGSTLLHEAIRDSACVSVRGRRWVSRLLDGEAWRLDESRLATGRIYKTHDYPIAGAAGPDPLVVYVFGDPILATLSLLRVVERVGPSFLTQHCDHLRVPPCAIRDVVQRDALRIGDHLDAWLNQRMYTAFMVRYEALWQEQEALSEFVGFPVTLPQRRPRAAHTENADLTAELHKVYGQLAERVAELPDRLVI